ncbi:UNVERIFIED_CONTAM: hypothetical protein GTU68_063406 [Idotea baltica]|nr:hypothetical protein [Idotea baltica]
MTFTPLHDRVLVRPVDGEEKTKGGLIIPDNAKEKPQVGEVVSVGAGAKDEAGARIAMDVKSGTEITIDDEDLMIMKESDILGIMA